MALEDIRGHVGKPALRVVLTPVLAGPPQASAVRAAARWDVYDGGRGLVYGQVTLRREPGARRVRLFDARSGRLLREAWSDERGQYRFDGVALDRDYLLIAQDHRRDFNAVAADAVRADPMPS